MSPEAARQLLDLIIEPYDLREVQEADDPLPRGDAEEDWRAAAVERGACR